MIPLSDLELLELIKNPATRDKGFKILTENYQRRVYGIIRKMVIIHEDADDILQNTFIKTFKNINKFNGDSTLFTWIYRIATNESLNFLEKKKRHYFFSMEDHQQAMEKHLDNSPYISGDEIQKTLQKIILKLPEKQRLVFNLKYYEDLSYEEISQITHTSIGALKASYHHAVKKIEQSIKMNGIHTNGE
ncbi:MAG: sigma-70 family RNA polymerase sigma factor [Anditalea sp.]